MAADSARFRAYVQEETDSAALYRVLADVETQPQLAAVYGKLADAESEHAEFWREKLRETGDDVGPVSPSWRARTLAWLARRFGPDVVLPTIRAGERSGGVDYGRNPASRDTALPADERSHARLLEVIDAPNGVEGATLARLEGRHRSASGNALRAAVLGANDGLVSNLSLVMGVAGAALAPRAILVTGLAGLVAGAGSMAMGEWLSVQSSRELYRHQLDVEAEELETVPEEEVEELTLIYRAKGLTEPDARNLAARLVADSGMALDTLAREELGIDPAGMGGSATEAAATSFALFALGAVVPVAPFAVLTGTVAVAVSVVLSALALFLIGAGITLLTGRNLLYSGGRQVVVGLAAAALTYGVGSLIGVAVLG